MGLKQVDTYEPGIEAATNIVRLKRTANVGGFPIDYPAGAQPGGSIGGDDDAEFLDLDDIWGHDDDGDTPGGSDMGTSILVGRLAPYLDGDGFVRFNRTTYRAELFLPVSYQILDGDGDHLGTGWAVLAVIEQGSQNQNDAALRVVWSSEDGYTEAEHADDAHVSPGHFLLGEQGGIHLAVGDGDRFYLRAGVAGPDFEDVREGIYELDVTGGDPTGVRLAAVWDFQVLDAAAAIQTDPPPWHPTGIAIERPARGDAAVKPAAVVWSTSDDFDDFFATPGRRRIQRGAAVLETWTVADDDPTLPNSNGGGFYFPSLRFDDRKDGVSTWVRDADTSPGSGGGPFRLVQRGSDDVDAVVASPDFADFTVPRFALDLFRGDRVNPQTVDRIGLAEDKTAPPANRWTGIPDVTDQADNVDDDLADFGSTRIQASEETKVARFRLADGNWFATDAARRHFTAADSVTLTIVARAVDADRDIEARLVHPSGAGAWVTGTLTVSGRYQTVTLTDATWAGGDYGEWAGETYVEIRLKTSETDLVAITKIRLAVTWTAGWAYAIDRVFLAPDAGNPPDHVRGDDLTGDLADAAPEISDHLMVPTGDIEDGHRVRIWIPYRASGSGGPFGDVVFDVRSFTFSTAAHRWTPRPAVRSG